jgi:hypothetical protein
MTGMTFVLNPNPPGGSTSDLGFDVIKVLGIRLLYTNAHPVYGSRTGGEVETTYFYLAECQAGRQGLAWDYTEIPVDELMREVEDEIYLTENPSRWDTVRSYFTAE